MHLLSVLSVALAMLLSTMAQITSTATVAFLIIEPSTTYTSFSTFVTTEYTVTETITLLESSTSTSTTTATIVVTPPPPVLVTTTIFVTSMPSSTSTTRVPDTTPPTTSTTTIFVTSTPPSTSTLTQTVTMTTTTAALPTVVYVATTCKKAVNCPKGTKLVDETQKCLNTFLNDKIYTTTCVKENCCTNQEPEIITEVTTCEEAEVSCPRYSIPLTDSNGVSVPCVETFDEDFNLLSTTCLSENCCTEVTFNKRVPCNTVIMCSTYKVNSSTGKIQTCRTSAKSSDVCTINRCCGTRL